MVVKKENDLPKGSIQKVISRPTRIPKKFLRRILISSLAMFKKLINLFESAPLQCNSAR